MMDVLELLGLEGEGYSYKIVAAHGSSWGRDGSYTQWSRDEHGLYEEHGWAQDQEHRDDC